MQDEVGRRVFARFRGGGVDLNHFRRNDALALCDNTGIGLQGFVPCTKIRNRFTTALGMIFNGREVGKVSVGFVRIW